MGNIKSATNIFIAFILECLLGDGLFVVFSNLFLGMASAHFAVILYGVIAVIYVLLAYGRLQRLLQTLIIRVQGTGGVWKIRITSKTTGETITELSLIARNQVDARKCANEMISNRPNSKQLQAVIRQMTYPATAVAWREDLTMRFWLAQYGRNEEAVLVVAPNRKVAQNWAAIWIGLLSRVKGAPDISVSEIQDLGKTIIQIRSIPVKGKPA